MSTRVNFLPIRGKRMNDETHLTILVLSLAVI